MVLNFLKCSLLLMKKGKVEFSQKWSWVLYCQGKGRIFSLKVVSGFLFCSSSVFRTLTCPGSTEASFDCGIEWRWPGALSLGQREAKDWISHKKTSCNFKFKEKVRNQELKLKWRVLKWGWVEWAVSESKDWK